MDESNDEISGLAAHYATFELLRLIMGEVFFTPDATEFRRRMQAVENAAVSGVMSSRPIPELDEKTNGAIQELASVVITNIMTSIRHPDETGNG
jgi:hypothetical protein